MIDLQISPVEVRRQVQQDGEWQNGQVQLQQQLSRSQCGLMLVDQASLRVRTRTGFLGIRLLRVSRVCDEHVTASGRILRVVQRDAWSWFSNIEFGHGNGK